MLRSIPSGKLHISMRSCRKSVGSVAYLDLEGNNSICQQQCQLFRDIQARSAQRSQQISLAHLALIAFFLRDWFWRCAHVALVSLCLVYAVVGAVGVARLASAGIEENVRYIPLLTVR